MNNQITIELISTFTCKRCVKAQQEIQALISACNYDINYKEVNVLEQIDYAVKLGVLRTLFQVKVNSNTPYKNF